MTDGYLLSGYNYQFSVEDFSVWHLCPLTISIRSIGGLFACWRQRFLTAWRGEKSYTSLYASNKGPGKPRLLLSGLRVDVYGASPLLRCFQVVQTAILAIILFFFKGTVARGHCFFIKFEFTSLLILNAYTLYNPASSLALLSFALSILALCWYMWADIRPGDWYPPFRLLSAVSSWKGAGVQLADIIHHQTAPPPLHWLFVSSWSLHFLPADIIWIYYDWLFVFHPFLL